MRVSLWQLNFRQIRDSHQRRSGGDVFNSFWTLRNRKWLITSVDRTSRRTYTLQMKSLLEIVNFTNSIYRGITRYTQSLRYRNKRYLDFEVRSRSSWYNILHYERTGNEKIISNLCVLPRSCSSQLGYLDYRWRRPYTITTMIGLEVVHWGFLQEGGSCQGYVFCAKGRKSIEPTHWYPVSGTSLSNCELWNGQKLAASVL